MRTPRNPTRRNRNIGTAKQGHGQDNKMVIPQSSGSRSWVESIGRHRKIERGIAGKRVTFLVEQCLDGWFHPCSIDDVELLLWRIPSADWAGLHTFVFRQPSRKQSMLRPAWGRLVYYAELTTAKRQVRARGPAVFLDAIPEDYSFDWPLSLQPDDVLELERLESDGHVVASSKKSHQIRVTRMSARNTQLYRTLPHEIGHWLDWLEKVEQPGARGESYEKLEDRYFARPRVEREAYAHHYAERTRLRLRESGDIPFDPR